MAIRAQVQQLANVVTAANVIANPAAGPLNGPAALAAAPIVSNSLLRGLGITPDASPLYPLGAAPPGTAGLVPFVFDIDQLQDGGEAAWLTSQQQAALFNLRPAQVVGAPRIRRRFLIQAIFNLLEDVNLAIADFFANQDAGHATILFNRLNNPNAMGFGVINYPGHHGRPANPNLANFVNYLDDPSGVGYLSVPQIAIIQQPVQAGSIFGTPGGEPLGCCNGVPNVPQGCCSGSWHQGTCP
jgi:hypothetical protein